MSEVVYYGEFEVEVGSPTYQRLVKQGAMLTDAPDVDEGSPYDGLKKAQLEKLVAERELEVTGTGSGGNVTAGDMRAALEANDAEGGTLGEQGE